MGEKTLIRYHLNNRPWNKIFPGLFICGSLIWLSLPVAAMDVVLAFTQVQASATSLDGSARTQMIINHLKRLDAGQVAVLVRTHELKKNRARISLYANAGHLIVNNGHRHHLLSRPDLYAYQADLLIADRQLRAYKNYIGHVYLANFETASAPSYRDKLMSFARHKMWSPLYVSVQVQDACLNRRYQQQVNRHRRVDMAALQTAYVDMIWQQLISHQNLVLATHGRAPLVLLLEEHDLTAYFLPGLVDRIRESGGRILAPQAVFGYAFVDAPPVNLHTHTGYLAALTNLEAPRLLAPQLVGGDNLWFDQFLSHHGLLQ
jgi:hypothetical protein